jgi:hypothetical protein
VVVVTLMLWSDFCGLSCCVTSIWNTITIIAAPAIATAAATAWPVDIHPDLCDSNSCSCSAAQSLSPSKCCGVSFGAGLAVPHPLAHYPHRRRHSLRHHNHHYLHQCCSIFSIKLGLWYSYGNSSMFVAFSLLRTVAVFTHTTQETAPATSSTSAAATTTAAATNTTTTAAASASAAADTQSGGVCDSAKEAELGEVPDDDGEGDGDDDDEEEPGEVRPRGRDDEEGEEGEVDEGEGAFELLLLLMLGVVYC